MRPVRGFLDSLTSNLTRVPGPARLLLMAAVLHPAVAFALYVISSRALLPDIIPAERSGFFLGADNLDYRDSVTEAARILIQDGCATWLATPQTVHVRFYSVSFALFGRFVGWNALAAEPLNLMLYLAILGFVFLLGREVFNRRVGVISSAIVALWPSFLLHTVQLLRDPLFIVAFLGLVLVGAARLTRIHSLRVGLAAGAGGGVACLILRSVRANWWPLTLGLLGLGLLLLVARQMRERRPLTGNWIEIGVLMAISLAIVGTSRRLQEGDVDRDFAVYVRALVPTGERPSTWNRFGRRVEFLRDRVLRRSEGAGSNVDPHVRFSGVGDVVRYLPRAAAIGSLSPFPEMWFTRAKHFGRAARLMAGAETLLTYVLGVLAVYGLWRGHNRFAVWWLALTFAIVVTTLGLVMPNIGTLYRMRYAPAMIALILASNGVHHLLAWRACPRLADSVTPPDFDD